MHEYTSETFKIGLLEITCLSTEVLTFTPSDSFINFESNLIPHGPYGISSLATGLHFIQNAFKGAGHEWEL